MRIYQELGKIALGSRLRMLTDSITADAVKIYQLYGIEMQPKWFPVFYSLSLGESKTITSISKEIGHSHPSVSKIVAEMTAKGFIQEDENIVDGRRTTVKLSDKGMAVTDTIKDQYTDVNNALEHLSSETMHDLWKAIEEWEYLLADKNLLQRVNEQKKLRENAGRLTIVEYNAEYRNAFKELNEEWISKYFRMEKADYAALDNPEGYILNKGGHILVALYDNKPVGVCALIRMDDAKYDFELAKMAVSPKAQGKSIGYLLGLKCINRAKSLGAEWLYLESNTILEPAINLYRKLGFIEVTGRETPYERCNIQMELRLK